MNNDSNKEIIDNPELKEQLKILVLKRVNVMPDSIRVAVGSEHLDKDKLKDHINNEDDIGNQMMEMELEFLQALSQGTVYSYE